MRYRQGKYMAAGGTRDRLDHNMVEAIDRRAAEGKVQTIPSTVQVSKAPNGARVFSLTNERVVRPTIKRWVRV